MAHPATRYYRDHVETPRPWGFEYAAYRQRTPGFDNSGYVTGWEADQMISRAKARGWVISCDPLGVVTIEPHAGRTTGRPATRRIRLEPVVAPHSVTPTQFDDLSILANAGGRARLHRTETDVITIHAGLWQRIPPQAAWILRRRGWTSEVPHSERLSVSAAGRIAMSRHWHATQRLHARLLKGLYLNAALTTTEEHG
ncbi:hypothetical protein [Streptomyces sp. NPDC096153]|uniref:hypothetical protein n=1 Tax=Streptomyces sp. NPDC096153 TaxID=3155548 RepID=UPI003317FB26